MVDDWSRRQPAFARAAPEPADDAWFTAEARAEWQRIRELLRKHALTVRPRLDTIKARCHLIGRSVEFTNEYPWRWRPNDLDQFMADLRSQQKPIDTGFVQQRYRDVL